MGEMDIVCSIFRGLPSVSSLLSVVLSSPTNLVSRSPNAHLHILGNLNRERLRST